jgi:hypothetical protein
MKSFMGGTLRSNSQSRKLPFNIWMMSSGSHSTARKNAIIRLKSCLWMMVGGNDLSGARRLNGLPTEQQPMRFDVVALPVRHVRRDAARLIRL